MVSNIPTLSCYTLAVDNVNIVIKNQDKRSW